MKIYRPTDSKGRLRPKWYITFYHNDKRRRMAVSTNKRATEKIARAGVHPSDAMVLARHSTITLTMNFYTHTHRESLQGIIDAQPDLTRKVPKKCPTVDGCGLPWTEKP